MRNVTFKRSTNHPLLTKVATAYEQLLATAESEGRKFERLRNNLRTYKISWQTTVQADDFRKAAREGLDVVAGFADRIDRTFVVVEEYSELERTLDLTKGATVQLFTQQQFERFITCVSWKQAMKQATTQEQERIALLGYSYQMVHPHHYQWLASKKEWEAKDVWMDRTLGPTGVEVLKVFNSMEELSGFIEEAMVEIISTHAYVDQHSDLHLIEGGKFPTP